MIANKSVVQLIIGFTGFCFLCLDSYLLLLAPTLIIPSWMLLCYIPVFIAICFGLGFLIKFISKSKWKTITFTSILISLFSIVYCVIEYSPSYEIIVPKEYSGTVMLFVTKEEKNDFKINESGVGYISQKTYESGFRPVILHGGQNVTDQIEGFASGAFSTIRSPGAAFYECNYISFDLPGNKETNHRDIEELIKTNAVDTSRLK